MTKIEEIVTSMSQPSKRYQLNMGAGKLAKKVYHCTPEEVKAAKNIIRFGAGKKEVKQAKVFIFDIETLPGIGYFWNPFDVIMSPDKIIKDWAMLSWSGKWLLSPEVYGDVLTPREAITRDDKRISASLWDYLDQADIVVTHNGDNFDIKKVNTRFLQHGFPPPSYYRSIDTFKVVKDRFGHTFKKLDFLARQLGLPKVKLDTKFTDWRLCDVGDEEALQYMLKYNFEDVKITEELYLAIRAWIKSHPNLALFEDDKVDRCPVCASKNGLEDGHFYHTGIGKYPTIRCLDCGTSYRSRISALTAEERKHMMSPIPK